MLQDVYDTIKKKPVCGVVKFEAAVLFPFVFIKKVGQDKKL